MSIYTILQLIKSRPGMTAGQIHNLACSGKKKNTYRKLARLVRQEIVHKSVMKVMIPGQGSRLVNVFKPNEK